MRRAATLKLVLSISLLAVSLGGLAPQAGASPYDDLSVFAGTGVSGYSGDGGQASSAQLDGPAQLTFDATGNLYVADYAAHVVHKITPGGVISTVAGTGIAGYSGDGGPATAAELWNPNGVGVDATGALYIADYSNDVIRKVETDGTISTFAGTGVAGYSGNGGSPTDARLDGPYSIEFDADGDLYTAEWDNNVVRKITMDGTISTFAGTGFRGNSGNGGPATSAWLDSPSDARFDSNGDLYIAEVGNNQIRKVTPGGIISLVAPAPYPYQLTFDAAGNLFFSDNGGTVQRIGTDGSIVTLLDLQGDDYSGGMPDGVAVGPDGNLYIADYSNNVILKLILSPTHSTVVGVDVIPVISLTTAGLNAGACNGATVTSTSSTGTAVSLRPTSVANSVGAQTLTVSTNAAGGYALGVRSTGQLTSGSANIGDWTGTNGAPTPFPAAGTAAFGYTTDGVAAFTANNWAGLTSSNQVVGAASSGPIASSTTRVCMQAGVSATTPAGIYTTTLIYTLVPTF